MADIKASLKNLERAVGHLEKSVGSALSNRKTAQGEKQADMFGFPANANRTKSREIASRVDSALRKVEDLLRA